MFKNARDTWGSIKLLFSKQPKKRCVGRFSRNRCMAFAGHKEKHWVWKGERLLVWRDRDTFSTGLTYDPELFCYPAH